MKDAVVEKVLQYLDNIGTTLSNGAEYGFRILVKQQSMEGIGFFIIVGFFLLICSILLIISLRKLKVEVDAYGNLQFESLFDVFKLIAAIISGVLIFFTLLTLAFSGVENFLKIANPEYYAIKEILDTIKGE